MNKIIKIENTVGRYWGLIIKWALPICLALMSIIAIPRLNYRDFWYDESATGIIARWPVWDIINLSLRPKYEHPPFYFVIIKYFTDFFGNSPFIIRGFSLVFGLVCVAGIYFLALKLFNRKIAFWAALGAATSPFVLQYATEARSYMMAGALIVLAAIFQLRAARKNKLLDHIWWGVFMALAVMVHYSALIFLPVFIFSYIVEIFLNKVNISSFKPKKWKNILDRLGKLAVFTIAALATFAIWLVPFISHFGKRTNIWIPETNISEIGRILRIFLFGSVPGALGVPPAIEFKYYILNDAIPYLIVIILAAAIIWLAVKFKSERGSVIQASILAFGPLIIAYLTLLYGTRLLVSRFIFAAALFLYLLIGVWLGHLRWRSRLPIIIIFVALIIARRPIELSQGYTQLKLNPPSAQYTLCALNPFDYSVAKYYLPAYKLALFNVANPEEDFFGWETIGPYRAIKKNSELMQRPELLIIYNKNLQPPEDKIPWEKFREIGRYGNLILYVVKQNGD